MAVIIGNIEDNLLEALAPGDELRGLDGNDTLIGSTGNERLLGGTGDDELSAGDGADYLDGGEGADTMSGGNGNDVYFVDNALDSIVDSDGQGRVNVYTNYTDTNGLTLQLQTIGVTGKGNGVGQLIISYADDTTLRGEGGNDVLKGSYGSTVYGGADNDVLEVTNQDTGTLIGGAGNDTYNVFEGGEGLGNLVIDEQSDGGSGTDTIFSTTDISLSNPSVAGITVKGVVEYLVLAAPGASKGQIAGPIFAEGDGNANIIIGNRQNNVLNGLGGADTIYASFGNDIIDGGNGNDSLLGQDGNDTLRAGLGTDTLVGGAGDDEYYINDGDTVVEAASEGEDYVYTSGNFTTSAEVEYIYLTGSSLTVTFNGTNDVHIEADDDGGDSLIGGSGDDTLIGKAGIDNLTGNGGADQFRFGGSGLVANGSTSTSIRRDIITDFVSGTDTIALDDATFLQLVNPANFTFFSGNFGATNVGTVSGKTMNQTNALFVYNTASGDLVYNENLAANGAGNGGIFANLQGLPTLAATDFVII
jgi:serralysin